MRECPLESEIDGLGAPMRGLKPKQRLISFSLQDLSLELLQHTSYRKTTQTLNRVLHREGYRRLSHTTLRDWTNAFGTSLHERYEQEASSVLEANGFSAESVT